MAQQSAVFATQVRRAGPVCLALAGLLAALLSTWAAPASASRWPSSTVTYRDHTPWGASVVRAVRWWNRTPGHVRLVRARPGRRANVNLYPAWLPGNLAGTGMYPPGGTVRLDIGAMREVDEVQRADIIAHEFGHALGLPHIPPRCSLMYKGPGGPGTREVCNRGLGERWMRCGPQRADARLLTRRYGGRVGSFTGFRCQAPGRTPSRPASPAPASGDVSQPDGSDTRRRLVIVVDDGDDHTVLQRNGWLIRTLGPGETATIDLGGLSSSDRVGVGTRNLDDRYSWRYRVYVDGVLVMTDEGSGNGRRGEYVRQLELDGWGRLAPG